MIKLPDQGTTVIEKVLVQQAPRHPRRIIQKIEILLTYIHKEMATPA
jgi:hypothetical protein